MAEPFKFISDAHLNIMMRDGWTPTEVRELIASYQKLKRLAARTKRLQQLIPEGERASYRPADFEKRTEEEKWLIDKGLGLLDWNGHTHGQTPPNANDS